MLADDVIAACGGPADKLFRGAITVFAHDIRQANRFDLTQGIMLSARTIHQSAIAARSNALSLCRLPFEKTWFEWPSHDPSGVAPPAFNSNRYAPHPRRCGAMVTVDETRQRGVMTWTWFTKGTNQGIHVCPLSVTFDWREEFEPVVDLVEHAYRRLGISKADAQRSRLAGLRKELPGLRNFSATELYEDRNRFGIIWSPYMEAYAEAYERDYGLIDQRHRLWQAAISDITGEPGMLQSVILLLNSRNLTVAEAVPTSERLNKQRVRKGRKPLLDYTTIRIKLSRALAQRAGAAGERSPSRMHVVSGHFKVRKSGIYWWNDHARGEPMQGTIQNQLRKVMV